MRRWTAVGMAATITACGGSHENGTGVHTHSTPNAHGGPVAHLAQANGAAPRDAAPTLITIASRGSGSHATDTAISTPVPTSVTTATPASGGYVVRSTGTHPSSTATASHIERATGSTAMHFETAEAAPLGGRSHSGADIAAPPPGTARTASTTSASGPSHGHERRSMGGGGGTGEGDGIGTNGLVAAAPRADLATGSGYMSPPAQMTPADAPARPITTARGAPVPVTTTVTIAVTPTPMPVMPVSEEQQVRTAGLLTAASVGDVDRRGNYLEYLSRHNGEANDLGLDMTRRVRFRVVDAQGRGVNDAHVTLVGDNERFEARTHADGGWDFYPSMLAPQFAGNVTVRAEVENVGVQAVVNVPSQGDGQGTVVMQLPAIVAPPPPALDLGFVIDVTGSMGDELRYVNSEIASIVQRIEAQDPGVRVRVSATFYRDRVDELLVQQIPFSDNVPAFANMMERVTASGGGDYPEDMNAGLEAAMTRLAWSEGPAVRTIILIADAPPQHYADEQFTYREAMTDAARRGIRILPVAASGADRNVEYLFRAMGAMTSTPYVYLTDDSGVGAAHMEADTDRVAVERFNDLLTRMVISDLHGEGMHEPGPLGHES